MTPHQSNVDFARSVIEKDPFLSILGTSRRNVDIIDVKNL